MMIYFVFFFFMKKKFLCLLIIIFVSVKVIFGGLVDVKGENFISC